MFWNDSPVLMLDTESYPNFNFLLLKCLGEWGWGVSAPLAPLPLNLLACNTARMIYVYIIAGQEIKDFLEILIWKYSNIYGIPTTSKTFCRAGSFLGDMIDRLMLSWKQNTWQITVSKSIEPKNSKVWYPVYVIVTISSPNHLSTDCWSADCQQLVNKING